MLASTPGQGEPGGGSGSPDPSWDTAARRCGVIGSPIAHSWSPALHQAAYAWLGLNWTYERHEVNCDTLGEFLGGLDDSWRGLSCTMPLKPALAALGVGDAVVAALGVANTVIFDGPVGDRTTTRVANTDVPGLIAALTVARRAEGSAAEPLQRAVVIGTGATATSAVYALGRLGVSSVAVVGRNPVALAELRVKAAAWGVTVVEHNLRWRIAPADVVISTIPAVAAAALAPAICAAGRIVFDVLYHPWPTPLLAAAQALGRTTVSGFDLLAHQAVGQIELMTTRLVPVEVLLELLPSASA